MPLFIAPRCPLAGWIRSSRRHTYEQLPIQDDAYSKVAYPKARSAALKAIELGPSLAEAYAALGVVKTFCDYDWAGAEVNFKRALAESRRR